MQTPARCILQEQAEEVATIRAAQAQHAEALQNVQATVFKYASEPGRRLCACSLLVVLVHLRQPL